MSQIYDGSQTNDDFGKARMQQRSGALGKLQSNFEDSTLRYLDEKIINHLLDTFSLEINGILESVKNSINDFSFFTAPSYKALEGFLMQIARDLKLPSSGNPSLVGSYYFDEEKVDDQIDKLLLELEEKAENEKNLSDFEKKDIKDRIKEMKGFLKHYRHTPAHYFGEPIDTMEKAQRNIRIIWGAIDNTTQILLKAKLVSVG